MPHRHESYVYTCSFGCNRAPTARVDAMVTHELMCYYNPNRKACSTCVHQRLRNSVNGFLERACFHPDYDHLSWIKDTYPRMLPPIRYSCVGWELDLTKGWEQEDENIQEFEIACEALGVLALGTEPWDKIKAGNPVCGGYKYPDSCHHHGKPQTDSDSCRECYTDTTTLSIDKPWDQKIQSETVNFCGGYKYPHECPHDGEPSAESEACQECYEDSRLAMNKEEHLAWGKPKLKG